MRWAIGQYIFDPATNVLVGPGGNTLLEPKVSGLLLYFLQNPYRDISRDELFETVWSGHIVSDGAINRVVVQLRKAIGDIEKIKQLIVTVPKVGYRFVGKAKEIDEAEPPAYRVKTRKKTLALALTVLVLASILVFTNGEKSDHINKNANLHPFIRLAGQQFAPTLSQDEKQIIFSQKTEKGAALYWAQGPSTSPVIIGRKDGNADAAKWSPTGKSIVYRFIKGNQCTFHMVEIVAGRPAEPTTIYECTPSDRVTFAFSPNGTNLYFSNRQSSFAPYHIYELDIDARSTRRLAQPVAKGRGNFHIDRHPKTGNLLLLSDEAPGKTGAYELDVDNNSFKKLMAWPHKMDFAVWGHEPNTIVHPGAHPSYKLIETSYQSRNEQVLLSDSRRIKEPVRIENGKDYLFTSYLQNRDILINDQPMVELNSSVMDYLPTLSRSGKKLAFISKRSGESKVWLADLDSSALSVLSPTERGQALLAMDWSFDDSMLLITTSGGLLVLDIAADAIVHRLEPPLPAHAASWSGKGAFTYSLHEKNRWQLYRHTLTTRDTAPLEKRWAFALASPELTLLIDQSFRFFQNGNSPVSHECRRYIRLQNITVRLRKKDLFCISGQQSSTILHYRNLTQPETIPIAISSLGDFSVVPGQLAHTALKSVTSDIMRTDFGPTN